MDRSSQEFDRQLFTLKMSELSRQMQTKSVASDRAANTASRTTGGSLLLKMVDGQLTLLREWLAGVDRVCREVWETQRGIVTAEFVRDVLVQEAMNLIEVRRSTVTANVANVASRMGGLEDPHPAQHHLAMEVNSLKGEVSTKYEIEVRTLEHKQAHKPKPNLPEPIKSVNTGFTSVSLTKAPAPPREVGGLGFAPYQPKPTEVPHEPPMYFSSDLWPKTNVILLKAQRGFPLQTQTVELCKRIVSEMTPLFVEAVRAGQMKAANVLREHGGGMEDLLHLLLVRNDPGPHSGWGISDAAYRLGQEVRKSDEWLRLGEAIAETQRLNAGEKQAEAAVQNNDRTAESEGNDLAPHAEEWRRGAEPPAISNFVSLSVPAGSTREKLIHKIAKQLRWRVGPLPGQLREFSYPRGRTVFGAANDILDQIAAEYKDMYWAEKGGVLRFAVKNTPVKHSPSAPRVENNRKTVQSTASGASNTRKTFLKPILEKKGFSIHDWANKANVDWHTADNYLNGKTNPYQSTRKRLAEALSIGVEELPA